MGNTEFGWVFGPQWRKVNILTNLTTPIHLNSLSIQLWELQFNGTTGISGRDLKLKLELILDKVMSIGADSVPFGTFLIGFDLEPVIIAVFVGLDVGDKGFELLFEPVFPFLVLWPRVDRQKRDLVCCLFDWGHHFLLFLLIFLGDLFVYNLNRVAFIYSTVFIHLFNRQIFVDIKKISYIKHWSSVLDTLLAFVNVPTHFSVFF